MLVYSHCSNNNKASTVLDLFQEAVAEYGLPSRVRCDKVCDNLDMARYIILHPSRGPGRGNVIVGKSVHNQRIARLQPENSAATARCLCWCTVSLLWVGLPFERVWTS